MNLYDEDEAGMTLARKLSTCVQSDPGGVVSMQNRLLAELHAGHRASHRKRLTVAMAIGILSVVSFAAIRTAVSESSAARPAAAVSGVVSVAGEGSSADAPSAAGNRTLSVSVDGDSESKLVMKQAITSLAEAVADAANGDTIELDEGTYALTDTISIANKSLTLKGAAGTDRTRVIIDGDGANTHRRCFYVNNTKDYAVRFEGLTIRNGYECGESGVENYWGGGIMAKGPLTVTNCVICDCVVSNGVLQHANIGGGGICVAALNGADVLISDTLFRSDVVAYVTSKAPNAGNGASAYGGGFYVSGASAERYRVENCVVSNCLGRANWSRVASQFTRGTPGGSGGYAVNATVAGCRFLDNGFDGGTTTFAGTLGVASSAVVTNCLFADNRASYGGGICASAKSRSYVRDCTITNNVARSAGGGLAVPTLSALDVRDTLIVGNSGSGAGVALHGTGSVISNCVIRGNVAGDKTSGGGVLFSSMEAAVCQENVITRSVIADNKAGGSGAGVMIINSAISNRLSEVIIADNTYTFTAGGNGYGVAFVVEGANAKGNVLRNSLVAGNTQKSNANLPTVAFRCNTPAATLGTFSAMIENCTIAGNILNGATCVIADPNSKMTSGYDAVRLYNNVIASNVRTKSKASPDDPYGVQDCFMVANNQIRANLVDADNWNEYTAADNFAGDPLFADAANGDYRLRKKSPAIGRGIVDSSWATRKTFDLGDGTYALKTHADDASIPEYGIRLTFNNLRKRVSGGSLDLGCFERAATGFVIIAK